MNNTVNPTPEFKRDLKPLSKKYKTLKETILKLEQDLIENPYLGESYGQGIYKVRVADGSKGKGKSGGFRVIYYHLNKTKDGIAMLLLNIFDKSETSTIKKIDAVKQLKAIIQEYLNQ
ncbi:type II toxin-antitoxin system RelE/ParE family toxin [Mucilaginibacter sp. BJC16-A38]|uniref:type II toxin-antitoxin system RelE/ParE family toxin n=1 Tax=Mucilaginibacter phenanthrenivorans TaxID=1234842 RepID=UPI0021585250|nr:type II toxin-antitoxin system RelE/ParE family toxin [Mucilaginibacter phenanthrenivorans]MCR8558381.1 type II toxin-antitoxin system RelE/ParE family toxin [Mucilaginibacter phenanthrenivorans]